MGLRDTSWVGMVALPASLFLPCLALLRRHRLLGSQERTLLLTLRDALHARKRVCVCVCCVEGTHVKSVFVSACGLFKCGYVC